MAKKSDKLTPRQQQSRQIMREKAARKKRQALLRKAALIGGGVLSVIVLGGSVWLWKSGAATRAMHAMVDGVYNITVQSGFKVQSLYLEGRNRTSMDDINQALDIQKGDPILRLSLEEVRERLEKIESIKFAAVERALPDTLYVRIMERDPVALWQNQGKITLIDDNGVAMGGIDITPYRHLPLVIGDSAPQHVKELLTILTSEPDLARRFAAAIYIGDRRWNIRIAGRQGGDNDMIEVKLPEDNPSEAWKKLANLQAHEQVLDRNIKVIDLRLPDRMFIKLMPENVSTKSANAKET